MLASVSCVLKEAMVDQLDVVVARILQALQSEDGITVSVTLLRRPSQILCLFPLQIISVVQVHYATSEVPFLDFDDEEEEDGGGDKEENAGHSSVLDDSHAIEG